MTDPQSKLSRTRSLLFVPGDRPERFAKAVAAGPDAVIIDLEDGVDIDNKAAARDAAVTWAQAHPGTLIRINGSESEWFEADLAATSAIHCTIMLAKCEAGPQLSRAIAAGPVIALIETARGVTEAREIARTGVLRLALGNADLAAELGIDPDDREAMLATRGELVLASAAARLPAPVDGVTTEFRNTGTVTADTAYAASLGFTGKLCIHPAQLEPVHAAFAPSPGELGWARTVLAAAIGSSGGAFSVGTAMIDAPILERARRIVERATPRNSRGQTAPTTSANDSAPASGLPIDRSP